MRRSALNRRWGRVCVWLLAGLLIGGAAGAGSVYLLKRGKAGIPGGPRLEKAEELAMVPADSIGFIHVRARAIWKTEELADLRRVIERAGPDALKLLDDGFVPAPSTVDRATLVLLDNPSARKKDVQPAIPGPKQKFAPPQPPLPPISMPEQPLVVGILTFTAAFDAGQVKSAYLPNAVAKTENGKEYFIDAAKGIGAYFPSDKVLVVGMAAGVTEFVKGQTADGKPSTGPLARPLAFAAEGGRQIVGAVNRRFFPINLAALGNDFRSAPPELLQLAKDVQPVLNAEAFSFGIGIAGEDSRLDLRGYYRTDKEAEDAEAGIRSAAAIGRKKLGEMKKNLDKSLAGPEGQKKPRPLDQLPQSLLAYAGLGGINTLDDLLANPPLKRDGSEVILSADRATMMNAIYGGYAAMLGALFESFGKVQMAADRMKDANNLKQIALTMHIGHDANQFLPHDITDQDGKPLLSWRVAILPYLDQPNLYKQFKLDEPWDSPNNKKLLNMMPPTYASPLVMDPPGKTRYKTFIGRGAAFERGQKMRFTDFTDGTSNTIMVVGGGEAVDWTKPDDIPFTGKIDPKMLMLPGRTGINVAMADGSVRWVELGSISPEKLSAAITRAGGEIIGLDWDDGPGTAFQKGDGDAFPLTTKIEPAPKKERPPANPKKDGTKLPAPLPKP